MAAKITTSENGNMKCSACGAQMRGRKFIPGKQECEHNCRERMQASKALKNAIDQLQDLEREIDADPALKNFMNSLLYDRPAKNWNEVIAREAAKLS